MEHYTLFHAWTLVTSSEDLAKVQTSSGTRAAWIYVLPKTILTAQIVYLAATGSSIPAIPCSLLGLGISWVSSFAVQVRMQLRLQASKGKDRAALDRMVNTTWVRTAGMIMHCVAVGYGLWQL